MLFAKDAVKFCSTAIEFLKINHFSQFSWNNVANVALYCNKVAYIRYIHQSYNDIPPEQRTLSINEANSILRENEQSLQLQKGIESNWDEALSTPSVHAIISVDSNFLASNTPIEDKLASAQCIHTPGFLFGVFDGHGGLECSHVISRRLFDYIAASLLPRSKLQNIISEWESGNRVMLTKAFNEQLEFIPLLQQIYDASLLRWCKQLYSTIGLEFSMEEALMAAFQQLDEDLGREAMTNTNEEVREALLRTVLSGSVACVAHIDGPHLHVANTGDCGGVIGHAVESSHGGWVVMRQSNDHNWENVSEVKRILSEHPQEKENVILQNQRLLGMLMPFRAFGDFRFKWDIATQKKVFGDYMELDPAFLSLCQTPPYLTVKPEVKYHHLNPHEKFLILGSDGLWESLGALDIVTIVGDYMAGRQTLQPVHLPKRLVSLGELSYILQKRREWMKMKPTDTNASTHLIRHCLGSTEEGLDHYRLSHSLTLPPHVRRYFRDDISIHVIFFDSNFIRICPIEL